MSQQSQQAITPPPIAMIPVTSSQIHSIGHHPDTNTLRIQFADRRNGDPGSVYDYANFTKEKFEAFRNAESIGKHFYAHIKPNSVEHPYMRIYDLGAAPVVQQAAVTEPAINAVASNTDEAEDDAGDEDASFPDCGDNQDTTVAGDGYGE